MRAGKKFASTSLASPALGLKPPLRCLSRCPSSVPLSIETPPASPALHGSRVSPDAGPAAPLSAAARQAVRQALYVPALVAARYNPELKAQYAKLVEAGKPAKVAAIMRKLLNSSDCAAN